MKSSTGLGETAPYESIPPVDSAVRSGVVVRVERRSPFTVVLEDGVGVRIETDARGESLLRAGLLNKGTAFDREERVALGLVGLLPPSVETLAQQLDRTRTLYDLEETTLGRYRFLRRLQDTNEILFHAFLARWVGELLPIVYTPTVGEGVERASMIWETARGLSLSLDDAGPAHDAIASVENDDVRMIVATDSSAILGIGDQGWNGLGIAIGKLALYTVGGVSPFATLPVVLDVGTDKPGLVEDPAYLGVKKPRLRGEPYLAFVRQFVDAVRARWPRAIVQWEDFGKESAFDVLDAFREVLPSFNDDIQGTGAVALAGLITAVKTKEHGTGKLVDERFLVFGAGAGGIGVARAIRDGLEHEGLDRVEATARVLVVDSKGLLVEGRAMEAYKREFTTPRASIAGWTTRGAVPTLLETIAGAKISALLGLSGQARTFDETVIRAVLANTATPIVFALSNPTTSCEATPADILHWTDGHAIVATGSPFDPVMVGGTLRPVGQGNNAFIFPGIGFGTMLADATKITDGMVAEAAYALAELTLAKHGTERLIYPPVSDLREAAALVAARVARRAIADGVARETDTTDLEARARRLAWKPDYLPVRRASGGAVLVGG